MRTFEEIVEEIFEIDEDCGDTMLEMIEQLSDEHSEKLTVKQFLEFTLLTIKDPDNAPNIEEYINSLV